VEQAIGEILTEIEDLELFLECEEETERANN